MTRWRKAAMALVVTVAATACLGEAPEPEVQVFVPKLVVSDQRGRGQERIDYQSDEPTGFTVHLSESDVLMHGLPAVLEFIGGVSGAGASSATGTMTAYEGDAGQPIPGRFECFDPIEIRNPQQETILTISNFCPADSQPSLRVIGDMSAGTPLGWIFESPDGESRNGVDEFGTIVAQG